MHSVFVQTTNMMQQSITQDVASDGKSGSQEKMTNVYMGPVTTSQQDW